MGNVNLRRVFLYSLIASVALSAAIGIGVILLRNFGEFEVRILMTTLTVTATSILGLACGAFLATGRGRVMPGTGIALSVLAAAMSFFIIWNVLDDHWAFVKLFLTTTLLAAACSHLSLLSLARLDRRFAWTRTAAFICVWLLTAMLVYILWAEPEAADGIVTRLLAVLAILVASITVITPVLHRLSLTETNLAVIDAEIEKLKTKIEELQIQKAELAGKETST